MRTAQRPFVATSTVFAALALFSACSNDTSTDGTTVTVTATDTSCELSDTSLSAGSFTFEVTNKGASVTELYVYGGGDRVMGEVENVGPGITQKFDVTLDAGTYEAACKPGMTGDGIRTPFKVA
ncbi:MAG: cupredoxin domain-containing protein [Nocardioidaceae bacterium]